MNVCRADGKVAAPEMVRYFFL